VSQSSSAGPNSALQQTSARSRSHHAAEHCYVSRTKSTPERFSMSVYLEAPSRRREQEFLEAVRRSRALHHRLVSPPRTREQFLAYLARLRQPSHLGHFICLDEGDLAGVVNINEIVRGAFRSGYLGYYAFAPYDARGNMSAGLRLVIGRAFRIHRLHRLEANIQPSNRQSIALVRALGFRLEGLSPRYLKISGRWRDHERWALTVEDWEALARRAASGAQRRASIKSGSDRSKRRSKG
jgi:ribosomal-protein-alanine N-acetyltransferase